MGNADRPESFELAINLKMYIIVEALKKQNRKLNRENTALSIIFMASMFVHLERWFSNIPIFLLISPFSIILVLSCCSLHTVEMQKKNSNLVLTFIASQTEKISY